MSKIFKPLEYDEWYEENEDDLYADYMESGTYLEIDVDYARFCEDKWEEYEINFIVRCKEEARRVQLKENKMSKKDKPMYINHAVLSFFAALYNFFGLTKKDLPTYRRGHSICPSVWYNHKSGTFKKNQRRGL